MKEKNEKIDKMLVICNNIVVKILNNDINKLDYVLTWSKYYFSLAEDTNNLGLALIKYFIDKNEKITLSYKKMKEIFVCNIYQVKKSISFIKEFINYINKIK